ncbi:hypothetical protein BDN71DRAFT_1445462 [Pleurotus eryngii]|uniref:Uncharacterized protein n=1 Tax=Pleurotus eryngii TaxID=5323 RepID=A0A9P6A0X7_PLEER|nr:hypothetical protein BDN71DRAFT_1445462 [Pleurotus eryngii]
MWVLISRSRRGAGRVRWGLVLVGICARESRRNRCGGLGTVLLVWDAVGMGSSGVRGGKVGTRGVCCKLGSTDDGVVVTRGMLSNYSVISGNVKRRWLDPNARVAQEGVAALAPDSATLGYPTTCVFRKTGALRGPQLFSQQISGHAPYGGFAKTRSPLILWRHYRELLTIIDGGRGRN